jgi:hypothetical protein
MTFADLGDPWIDALSEFLAAEDWRALTRSDPAMGVERERHDVRAALRSR